MRIWVVARVDVSGRKGGATHVRQFVAELTKRGHELRLFVPRPAAEMPELACDFSLLPAPRGRFWISHLLFELWVLALMLRLAPKERPGAVYVRHGLFCLAPLLAARLIGRRAVLEQNGVISEELTLAGRPRWEVGLQQRFERLAYGLARRIVVVTPGIRDYLIDRLGVSPSKLFVAANGADPDSLHPQPAGPAKVGLGLDPQAPVIGYLGNFEPYQDLDTLIEALALLAGRGARFNALFVGGGTRFEQVRALAAQRGLAERCLFSGPVSHDQVERHIAAMDVCVVPKRPLTSGYSPIKLFEYLACARPVVASDLPGFGILQERGLGLLAAAEDPRALAEALTVLLSDPMLREQMGRRGRAYVEGPGSWSASVGRVLEVIRGG